MGENQDYVFNVGAPGVENIKSISLLSKEEIESLAHYVFNSTNKYESNCGWPSFDQAIPNTIVYIEDLSHNMKRIEVKCSKCDGHLGHVFNDGPKETTGKRYCINSAALSFNKK